MSRPEASEIPDDLVLTQWGEWRPDGRSFANMLRVDSGETDMSLIWGRVDAPAASMLVTKSWQPLSIVRHVVAVSLRDAGFEVIHTPSKSNRLHVSVYTPFEGRERAVWDELVAKRFDSCFTVSQGGDTNE